MTITTAPCQPFTTCRDPLDPKVPVGRCTPGTGPRVLRERLLRLKRCVARQIEQMNALLYVERRSKASIAQVITYAYLRRGRRGLVYCATPREARRLAGFLQGAGISAQTGSVGEEKFAGGEIDTLIRAVGTPRRIQCPKVRYVLHTSPPASLDAYLTDVRTATNGNPPVESVILYSNDDVGLDFEVEAYCRIRTCRHAHLVRRSKPGLIEPPPYAFSCHRCDVCLGEPHGIHEEECGQLVTV